MFTESFVICVNKKTLLEQYECKHVNSFDPDAFQKMRSGAKQREKRD